MLQLTTPEMIARECLAGRVRLLEKVITSLYDEVLRPYGLNVDRVSVLTAVACSGGAGNGDLCRYLHVDAASLGREVELMRERGWLETAPPGGDGRTHRLRLTAAGHALYQEIGPAWRAAQKKAEEILGPGGVAALREMTADLWPQREERRRPPVPA